MLASVETPQWFKDAKRARSGALDGIEVAATQDPFIVEIFDFCSLCKGESGHNCAACGGVGKIFWTIDIPVGQYICERCDGAGELSFMKFCHVCEGLGRVVRNKNWGRVRG